MAPDALPLFPGLTFGRGPANGGCVAPIGRRRNRRAQPALRRVQPPSPIVKVVLGLQLQLSARFDALLAALGRLEQAITGLTAPATLEERLAQEIAMLAQVRRDEAELLVPILKRLVTIERMLRGSDGDIGRFPKHSRRRPLGQ
jgi:hypothetical protein